MTLLMGFIARHPPRQRTGWHPGFSQLIAERGPGQFNVHPTFPLGQNPRELDLLLVRRTVGAGNAAPARVLLKLWPLIAKVGLLEFKSPSREFRSGDLVKLYSYGYEYLHLHLDELAGPRELTLVFVTPRITEAIHRELTYLEASLEPLDPGYARVVGGVQLLPTYLVDTGEVARTEEDAYLSIFSHVTMEDPEAARWFHKFLAHEVNVMDNTKEIEDFDDMFRKLRAMLGAEEMMRKAGLTAEQRLAGLDLEQRLAGLDPEQRLAGLTREQLKRLRAAVDQKLNGA